MSEEQQITAEEAPAPEVPEELEVTIEGEAPAPAEEEPTPEWVRDLRKRHKESQRKIKQLEQENQSLKAPSAPKATLGPKPKLEDFDYDGDKFADAVTAWHESKREHELEAKRAQEAKEAEGKAWQERLDAYGAAKAELKTQDYEEAELNVQERFSAVQQGIVLQGAQNPALVVYALGKNESKLAELAAIKDPVQFAFAVAKLEAQLKVGPRKAPPQPEKAVASGTAPKSGTVDSVLEQLRADAAKTGDFSKVMAYRRQQAKN